MLRSNSIDIIGHRGAAGLAPENTLSAISAALDLNVNYVEIDIRLSKDEVAMVLHDNSLHRTTGLKKYIHLLTSKEIRQLDGGKWFDSSFTNEKIPTLEEVLELLQGKKTGLMIEIKHCPQPNDLVVDRLFQILKKFEGSLPPLIIGGFNVQTVQKVKTRAAKTSYDIKTIGLAEKHHMIHPFIHMGVDIMGIWHKIITPGLPEQLTGHHVRTWSFTVNDLILAKFLVSIGVTGIISNYPNLMRELV